MIKAFFDGCCEPVNPGGTASYGAVVFRDDVRIWECSELFRPEPGREKETSNNVAEYGGFIAILEYLLAENLQGEHIEVYGDSRLVIHQIFEKWRIKKGFYVPLAYRAREIRQKFPKLYGHWIPREENGIADELSKAELKKAGVRFVIQPE